MLNPVYSAVLVNLVLSIKIKCNDKMYNEEMEVIHTFKINSNKSILMIHE